MKGANVDGDHLQGAAEEPPGQVRPRSSETISIIEIWYLEVLKPLPRVYIHRTIGHLRLSVGPHSSMYLLNY